MARNCIVKRLYEKGTPYIQIAGWIPIVVGVLAICWNIFGFGVGQTQAFAALNERLQKQHDEFLTIKQEVHDLHEWMRPRKK